MPSTCRFHLAEYKAKGNNESHSTEAYQLGRNDDRPAPKEPQSGRCTKAVQRRPNRSKGVFNTRHCLGRTLRFQGLRGDGDIQGDAKS